MNYKFLIGARRAGVTLALILLGAMGALAAVGDVTINLADVRLPGSSNPVSPNPASASGSYKFAGWIRERASTETTPATAADSVYASFSYNSSAASPWEKELTITIGANVKPVGSTDPSKVSITGTFPTSINVDKIYFTAAAGSNAKVVWDGATVVGATTNGADTVSVFLRKDANVKMLHLLWGSITTNAVNLLKEVAVGEGATSGNVVGSTDGTDVGNLTLKSNGTGPVLVSDNPIQIIAGRGTYTIEGVKAPAIRSKSQVKIGTDITANIGNGVINIVGYSTAPTGTEILKNQGAIESPNVEILGRTTNSALTVISSKSKYVIYAVSETQGVKGTVVVKNSNVVHEVAANTDGAAVFSTDGSVNLDRANVNGSSTAANTDVRGGIITAGGNVTVKGGAISAAAGGRGGEAIFTTGSVTIIGTSIRSSGVLSGVTPAIPPSYVVSAIGGVELTTYGDTGRAYIGYTGPATNAVGGISTKSGNVKLDVEGSKRVTVEIVNGAGTGIFLSDDISAGGSNPSGSPVRRVWVKGSGNVSGFVTVATGQAIAVDLKNGGKVSDQTVLLDNAAVERKSAAAAGAGSLISVIGGGVRVEGTSKSLSYVKATAGSSNSIGIYAADYNGNGAGGDVTVAVAEIAGITGAIEAISVVVADSWTVPGTLPTVITSSSSTANVTIKSRNDIVVNNRYAVIKNAGAAGTVEYPGAALYSYEANVYVYNADSIFASSTASAIKTSKGDIKVYGGLISSKGTAIAALGDLVVVDGDPSDLRTTNAGSSIGPVGNAVTVYLPLKNITVTSEATVASYSAITAAPWYAGGKSDVYIGKARIQATGTSGFAAAIRDSIGSVFVDDREANISSASGSAIFVMGGNVNVVFGEVRSAAQSNAYAAIAVVDGSVKVGDGPKLANGNYDNSYNDKYDYYEHSNIVSDGRSLGILVTSEGDDSVNVYEFARLEVKGTEATAGAIKVQKTVRINFYGGALTVSNASSKAFCLLADRGNILISGGKITSQQSTEAIKTTGGEIGVTNSGRSNVSVTEIGTLVTAKGGRLIWAKDTTGRRAGEVKITGKAKSRNDGYTTRVINERGTTVKADYRATISGLGALVETFTDTAVTVGYVSGTTTVKGEVYVKDSATVWASGADVQNSKPIAIVGKNVYISNEAQVWANTERLSADDEEAYKLSSATGILIPERAGESRFVIEGRGTVVRAFGAGTAIKNLDTATTVEIYSGFTDEATGVAYKGSKNNADANNDGVLVQAGSGGTAINSKGDVKVRGKEGTRELARPADNRRLLGYDVHIKAGNRAPSRAIWMPVPSSLRRKTLWLRDAVVEAGSDGAIAIETDVRVIDSLDHSVILVRHGSTGVKAEGGVYVDGSYIEVLATEDNQTGTAIIGSEINISGGSGTISEVHTKGTAVKLSKEGSSGVQITGVVAMSGRAESNVIVGSSVIGGEASLTAGSASSWQLYKLSPFSELTDTTEYGRTLTIPKGITVSVTDNGSSLGTERSDAGDRQRADTIRVEGVVTTVGTQASAHFINRGKVIVENGGDVRFNKQDVKSFYNEEGGIIVLKLGAKLDNIALVHDTGDAIAKQSYTFLKWAKILNGDSIVASVGLPRGQTVAASSVIIPPVYATLYGNPRTYIDDEDMEIAGENGKDFWNAYSSRTDSVYTTQLVKYPLDRRYKPYLGFDEKITLGFKNDRILSGQGTIPVEVTDEGTIVLLTEANTFVRRATFTNEAGEGWKEYTHNVTRVDYNRIRTAQDNAPIFFDGYLVNSDGRVDRGEETRDTVSVYDEVHNVKYTGSTAKLLDGVRGAATGYRNLNTDKDIFFDGLGNHQFWYKSAKDETGVSYPLTSNVPTKVGKYDVYASFAQGRNFDAVPAGENSVVYIGTVEVIPGDLTSVFNKRDNVYTINVELQEKTAYSPYTVSLPNVKGFGAKYNNEGLLDLADGTAKDAVTRVVLQADSVLAFTVNRNTEAGQYIEFPVGILNVANPGNFEESDEIKITVHANILTAAEMKEATPAYINVDYRNEKLTGLITGVTYTINGEAVTATSSELAIDEEWVGQTIKVVAQRTTQYKSNSDTAKIVIGSRLPAIPETSISVDDATSATALNGRITGTTAAMEYKDSTAAEWTPASSVVTTGLKAGVYFVRLAPTETAFAGEPIRVVISVKSVSIADANREIPTTNGATEAAVAPVKIKASAFTAGPSPVSKNGTIKFFSTKQVKSGTLYIFDATGKSVGKVRAKSGTGEIGSWNVGTKAEGLYLIKGALVGKDGTKEKVSFVFSVVK